MDGETKGNAKWKVILVFLILVPMIVLAGIIFSSLGSRPPILPDTVNQNLVTWESVKPAFFFSWEQRINSIFFDAGWINASVYLGTFDPGMQSWELDLNLSASLREGFVQNVTVAILSNSSTSYVDIYEIYPTNPSEFVSWENLNLTRYGQGLGFNGNAEKAFVEFMGDSSSHETSISVRPFCWLEGTPNETQQVIVSFETTYFNGTNYKKVVQPFSLKLFTEYEGTFATAREVMANQTVTAFIVGDRSSDFFEVYLEQGETFNATVFPGSQNWGIILRLYSSADENNPLTSSPEIQGNSLAPESISYSIKSTGWYYIKAEWLGGMGPISLNLTALSREVS